ncbi:MAG: hypothetical protein LUC33_06245 [Prevotellaceae bacterium]|nr:hypothetical protein [Prevotellaceae bacterium]
MKAVTAMTAQEAVSLIREYDRRTFDPSWATDRESPFEDYCRRSCVTEPFFERFLRHRMLERRTVDSRDGETLTRFRISSMHYTRYGTFLLRGTPLAERHGADLDLQDMEDLLLTGRTREMPRVPLGGDACRVTYSLVGTGKD